MSSLLVLGTADWDQPIATNQHYMVRELASDHGITYMESLGLRRPELSRRDLKRALTRLGRGNDVDVRGRHRPDSLTVLSPKSIPHHTGVSRRFNQLVVDRLTAEWRSSPGPKFLWTYSPVTYGLELSADVVVYHCVDLLGKVEGIPEGLIAANESHLSNHADVAIGSSELVTEHLREKGFTKCLHWPNVADTGPIDSQRPSISTRSPGRAVFAGNLSTTKVDFSLLEKLMIAGCDLHLAGPVAEGGGSAANDLRRLTAAGATYHGLLAPDDLASLYWSAEIGLIPYLLNSYTQGVSPLKTYEYLAAGLRVVSTDLPGVKQLDGDVAITRTSDEFVNAYLNAGSDETEGAQQRRIRIASDHSWTVRGRVARDLVSTLFEQACP